MVETLEYGSEVEEKKVAGKKSVVEENEVEEEERVVE